jgi:GTP-binding protein
LADLDMIEEELTQYGGLDDRPRIVALNKIDVPDGRTLAEMVRPDLEARGLAVFEVSASSHEGLRPLIYAMAGEVLAARKLSAPAEAPRIVIKPKAVDEAVGYLADRLQRLGVEAALMKQGATFGSEVLIGPEENAVVFDWEPSTGSSLGYGPRGSDPRLEGR